MGTKRCLHEAALSRPGVWNEIQETFDREVSEGGSLAADPGPEGATILLRQMLAASDE